MAFLSALMEIYFVLDFVLFFVLLEFIFSLQKSFHLDRPLFVSPFLYSSLEHLTVHMLFGCVMEVELNRTLWNDFRSSKFRSSKWSFISNVIVNIYGHNNLSDSHKKENNEHDDDVNDELDDVPVSKRFSQGLRKHFYFYY